MYVTETFMINYVLVCVYVYMSIFQGLYEPSYTFYAAILGHIVLLIVLSYFVLQWFGVTWWSVALSLILFSTAQVIHLLFLILV
jgi:hypothetical protein